MAAEKLDALISSDPASVRYATGFRGEPRMLLLTPDQVVLYTSFRTLPWAKQQTQDVELFTSLDPLGEILHRLHGSSVVGVDPGISFNRMSELQRALDKHSVRISAAIGVARRIKSGAEINCLRESQRCNEEVFEAVMPRIRPGMTERGVQGLILAEIAGREDLEGYAFPPIVAAGANAWEIHHLPDATPLRAGDMVIVDLGVMHYGYASDMTRTICLGEPTARMREVYDCVSDAQTRAFNSIHQGASTREVDAAARDVISRAGHDRGFTHGLGHSIGLEVHDPGLNLRSTDPDIPLEPGMAFTIEPGIYLEGEFGVRTEDTVIVQERGYENLTRQSHDLMCLPL
jgi:Xaa-Pro aminopeptidase